MMINGGITTNGPGSVIPVAYGGHPNPWNLSAVVLSALLIGYISIYPPFFSSCLVEPFFRLSIETSILLGLLLYSQVKQWLKIPKNIVWLGVLILLYGLFSLEESKQVLSFFNKYVFFILLLKVIHNNRNLILSLRQLWVAIWTIFSISAVIACLGFVFNFLPWSTFEFSNYTYQHNLLLGLILPKHADMLVLPRYTGWFIEPGYTAFFFGVNILVSNNLLPNSRWARYFKWCNAVAGLLTFSVTFYVFFFVYYSYKALWRKIPKVIIGLLCCLLLFLLILILINPNYASYTSLTDRTWRYAKVWEVYGNINLVQRVFGFGILPLQAAVGGGSTSGLMDIFVGRGVLLFGFLALLIFRYSRYNPTLVVFIIYYNLSFSVLTYPIFLFIIALVYESHFLQQHPVPFRQLESQGGIARGRDLIYQID